MNKMAKLAELRHFLARYGLPPGPAASCLWAWRARMRPAGRRACDAAPCTKSLRRVGAASGFAALLAMLAGGNENPCSGFAPIMRRWNMARSRPAACGAGRGSAPTLYGAKPQCRRCAVGGRRHSGLSACGCAAAGIGRRAQSLDLVASRRLVLARRKSGVTAVMLREGAAAAAQRGADPLARRVRASPDAMTSWGMPIFAPHSSAIVWAGWAHGPCTWNPERWTFPRTTRDAPHPGAVAAAASDRPADKERRFAFLIARAAGGRRTRQQRSLYLCAGDAARKGWVSIKASRWPMPGPWSQPLTIVPADEKADAALLEGIADWCDRFTPLVACDPPDGLMLDITGAAHLFGGEAAMLASGDAENRRPGLCRAGRHCRHHPWRPVPWRVSPPAISRRRARKRKACGAVPVAALDCGRKDHRARLRRAGLKTIGQVVAARRATNWRRASAKPLSRELE